MDRQQSLRETKRPASDHLGSLEQGKTLHILLQSPPSSLLFWRIGYFQRIRNKTYTGTNCSESAIWNLNICVNTFTKHIPVLTRYCTPSAPLYFRFRTVSSAENSKHCCLQAKFYMCNTTKCYWQYRNPLIIAMNRWGCACFGVTHVKHLFGTKFSQRQIKPFQLLPMTSQYIWKVKQTH